MRVLMLTLTALLMLAPDSGAATTSCCDDHKGCAEAVCCKHHKKDVAPEVGWPTAATRPIRESAKVLFRDPVRVGGHVLMGAYVIEHDYERMAQGRPCTHIYAADDRRVPVVAFHCRHLDRYPNPKASVTLQRLPDPTTRMFKLVEFQFEDGFEGHGVPDNDK